MQQSQNRNKLLLIFGLLLTAFAATSLIAAVWSILVKGNMDFPCEWFGAPQNTSVNEDTRIAYCISWYPRNYSGGGVYAEGTTTEDRIMVSPQAPWHSTLTIQRREDAVTINNQLLQIGMSFHQFAWFPSANPWLLYGANARVTNEGLLGVNRPRPVDALYVSGDVKESWLLNPLGLIILAMGAWLWAVGAKSQKQTT